VPSAGSEEQARRARGTEKRSEERWREGMGIRVA
jgi:hypothetical protein